MSKTQHQPTLFDNLDLVEPPPINLAEITGLTYLPEFIDPESHDDLLANVDSQPWLNDLRRRVQHYGYKYDYKARRVDPSMRIGALPGWAMAIAEHLVDRGLMRELPDQLIINEYKPGQGIANHVDCVPCFTDSIASLSLGSSCVMTFTSKETGHIIPLLLEPRSLVALRGEARYGWTHGIATRKTDAYQGRTIHRGRRVSLTFRKVILNDTQA
jgi:alkylated DNA repair dioxygenase AlkB